MTKERVQGKIVSFNLGNNESRFVKCKLKLMHDGLSKNRTQFTKETMMNCIENTVKNTPILCHVYKDEDGKYQIGNHDMDFDIEKNNDGDYEFVVTHYEKPVGFIPESAEVWYEEEDGRTYAYANGLLWKHYMDKLNDLLLAKDCVSNISTELNCTDADINDENILDIKQFELLGTTIISAETGMHNTTGEFYFSNEDTMTVEDMQLAYSEELRGGEKESMDENKGTVVENSIEEQEKPQVNEVVENSVEDLLDEEVVENSKEDKKKDDEKEPSEGKKAETSEEEDDKDKKKVNNELQQKYEELQIEYDNLKQENLVLNEKLESMKDYEELKEFKLKADRVKYEKEVNEITSKFGLDEDSISELKDKVLNYELNLKDYEKELAYLFAMKKLAEIKDQTFSKQEEKEEMPQIDDNSGLDNEPYGGLFNILDK